MRKILVSDFSYEEMPHGGSEVGNQMLIEQFDLEFIKSSEIKSFDKENYYIISNISLMNPRLITQLMECHYIIFECDYKIVGHRHPWRYPNDLIPENHRINYDLYERAEAIFVKSTDHLNVYKKNGVKGNFINLRTNIWSEDDLKLLEELYNENTHKNGKYCIYKSNNWIKNTDGAIKFCEEKKLPFGFIENGNNRRNFLNNMAKFSYFVFLPMARETYCRVVVEAKCLGLDVITTYVGPSSVNTHPNNYGATMEDYFRLKGLELINYLRMGNKININKISKYLE